MKIRLSSIKRVLKNSSIYGLSSILQKALGFFLLPVYTAYLTTTDYGIVGVVNSITGFVSILCLLGLQAAYIKFYYEYSCDEEKLKELAGTITLVVIINSLILNVVLVVSHKFTLDFFTNGINFYPYMVLGIIAISLAPTYNVYQTILQTKQLAKKAVINLLFNFLTNLLLTLFFIIILKLGAVGMLLATAFTSIIFFISSIYSLRKEIKFKINIGLLIQVIKYSLPLIPHFILGFIMSSIDRIMLNYFRNASEVGIYNIGFQFGNLITIAAGAINQAFTPWFFENMKIDNGGKRRIIRFATFIVFGYGISALCISLFGQDILAFMVTKDFKEAWKVIPLFCFSSVFNGMFYFFISPLFYENKVTFLFPVTTLIGAIISLVSNVILIPRFGMVGAAASNVISVISCGVMALILSNRIGQIIFNWKSMYTSTIILFSLSLFSYFSYRFTPSISLIIRIGIVFIIFALAYIIFRKEIKEYARIYIKSVKKV